MDGSYQKFVIPKIIQSAKLSLGVGNGRPIVEHSLGIYLTSFMSTSLLAVQ